MDPAAIERARQKAEAVRASLQRKQQSIVERRRLEQNEPSAGGAEATPAEAATNITSDTGKTTESPGATNAAPALKNAEAPSARVAAQRNDQPSGTTPSPPVMEDFTASANDDDDDEDDTTSTFHADEEMSATQGTGAVAVSVAAGVVAKDEVQQAKGVRFSLSSGSPPADEPSTSLATNKTGPRQPQVGAGVIPAARAGGSLRSASITRQVLSSSDSASGAAQPREPRYLRYRDSLRTSLQKSSSSAARDSVASSDDTTTIKNQLLSYFDKSLPPVPPSVGSASMTADAPSEPREHGDIASQTNLTVSDEPDVETGNALALALGSSADSSSQGPITPQPAPLPLSSPSTNDAELAANTAAVESKHTGKERKSQGRAVSFDTSNEPPSPRVMEDLSESDSSYQAGTLTALQYRRRRAMQLGALALLLVIIPLAIGLGVAYANRPPPSTSQDSTNPVSPSGPVAPTSAPSASLVATSAPTIAPSPATTAAPMSFTDRPAPTIAQNNSNVPSPSDPPVTSPPTLPPTEIVFAPVTSILDLLVAGNSTRRAV